MGSAGLPNGSRASLCTGRWGYGLRLDDRSRMSREVHVRICKGVGVRLPRVTRRVCAFEHQTDAERFYNVLGQRLGKFGLQLSAAKTRIIPFSPACLAGKTSFEFLGLKFRWGKDRKGQDQLKRRPTRKKLRASLNRSTAWWKEKRHLRLPVLFQRLHAKLRGYYNYYGVHGNAAAGIQMSMDG